jgi:hypothetical protein
MEYSNFVGRIGVLAVVLGVGSATAAPAGIAWANPDTTGDSPPADGQGGRHRAGRCYRRLVADLCIARVVGPLVVGRQPLKDVGSTTLATGTFSDDRWRSDGRSPATAPTASIAA